MNREIAILSLFSDRLFINETKKYSSKANKLVKKALVCYCVIEPSKNVVKTKVIANNKTSKFTIDVTF